MHLGNTKGRYARICIKLPIEILIRKQIQIGNLKQGIFYKGTDIFYFACGRIGHRQPNCTYRKNIETKKLEQIQTKDNLKSMTSKKCKIRKWISKQSPRHDIPLKGEIINQKQISVLRKLEVLVSNFFILQYVSS